MTHRERLVVYGLLALLLAGNLSVLFGFGNRRAQADAWPGPGPANDLGPADALVLSSEGDAQLVLRNRGSRLSWGEQPTHRAHSTAFVYIGAILRQLMQSDAMTEERERLVAELNDEGTTFQGQLQTISEQLQTIDRDSTDFQRLYEEGMAVQERYVTWQQEAMTRRGQLDASHLESAYRELVSAVEVVADRRDIDIVYRFIPTEDPFGADNPDQAMAAIRLRSALRYPTSLDITDEVLEELSLERDP